MQLNTRALKYLCICKILLSCIFITELNAAEKATQPQTKNETEKSKARLKLDESLKLDEFSETQGKTLNETLDEYKRKPKGSSDLKIDLKKALDENQKLLNNQANTVENENTKKLSIAEVRAIALEHNLSLKMINIDPILANTVLNEEAAKFDNIIFANMRYSRKDEPAIAGDTALFKSNNPALNNQEVKINSAESKNNYFDADAGILVPLRSGGSVKLSTPFENKESKGRFAADEYRSALKFSISQPLLRNAGTDVNAASINIAKFDLEAANVKTRLQSIRIIATVDKAYWDVYEAWNELEVRYKQYEFANQNLSIATRRVQEGTSAAIEINRAEFGVADRVESLIIAKTKLKLAQRQLKFLLNDTTLDLDSNLNLVTSTEPMLVSFAFDREKIVTQAKLGRLELLEQELKLAADLTKIDYLENQTLPLFTIDYQYGALSDSRSSFANSVDDSFRNRFNEWSVGLRFELPMTNEARKAQLDRAVQQRLQRLTTRTLQEMTVRREIYDALDQTDQNWQRIVAARQQVLIAGNNYEAESKQFNEGLRTMTEVLEMLTRLGEAQIKEIRAISDYQVSLIDLSYATGTLLGYSKVNFQ